MPIYDYVQHTRTDRTVHLSGQRIIIIDAMQTRGGKPGAIYMLALEDLPDLSAGRVI